VNTVADIVNLDLPGVVDVVVAARNARNAHENARIRGFDLGLELQIEDEIAEFLDRVPRKAHSTGRRQDSGLLVELKVAGTVVIPPGLRKSPVAALSEDALEALGFEVLGVRKNCRAMMLTLCEGAERGSSAGHQRNHKSDYLNKSSCVHTGTASMRAVHVITNS